MTDLSYNAFQTGSTPPPQGFIGKNITTPIGNAFSGAINQIGQGQSEATAPASNPLQAMGNLVKGGAHMAEGIVGAVSSPLAPLTAPIGKGVNAIADTISDNPSVQKFANSSAGKVTANVASGVNTVSNIAGGVAGLQGAGELAGNVWDKAYGKGVSSTGIDMATQGLESQTKSGVNAQQAIDTQVGGFQKGLGQAFSEAPKQIEQINPNARVTLPNDLMDKLNALKDTKKFALPDYLRTSSPEFGNGIKLGDIEKGISLSPTEMQDLMTKINKLTYAAKASGDLEVNQSTIGLNKDLHSVASDAFGKIKDDNGNVIWDKAYENYSKGINAVDKISDIFNSNKVTTASDFNKTMNTIKSLSKDPQGRIILQNSLEEFKNQSGIDLTNPTAEISKILDSEEFLKEAKKPSFLAQTFNKQYMSRTLVRIVEYATFGTVIRNLVKNVNQ